MEIDESTLGILNFQDEANENIKIRPSYYIHNAILMAQRTLMFSVMKTSVGDGIIAYSIFIEHIEVLCKAANYLTDDYKDGISKYKDEEEYKKAENNIKIAKLSNKKLELLMKEVFHKSDLTSPLKDSKKKITGDDN